MICISDNSFFIVSVSILGLIFILLVPSFFYLFKYMKKLKTKKNKKMARPNR